MAGLFHLKTKERFQGLGPGPKEEISLLQPLWAQDRAKEEVCHSAGPAGRGRTNKLDLHRGAGEMKLAEVLIHLGPHLVVGQETWLGRKAEMEEAIREASQVRGQPEAQAGALQGGAEVLREGKAWKNHPCSTTTIATTDWATGSPWLPRRASTLREGSCVKEAMYGAEREAGV